MVRLRSSTALRYGLLYAAVSLAMSWPVLLGYVPLPVEIVTGSPVWRSLQGDVTYRQYGVMEDLVRSFYPWHRLIGEAVRAGTIPLWMPYVLNGFPLHAANATGIFAPLTLLFSVLPVDAAWTLGFLVRPALAALGTALFARALGLGHSAALGAGFVFAWSGFQAGWAGQAMVDVTIWLPWILLGVLRVAEAPTPARIGLTALAFAFPVLSGHPEVAAYVLLLGAAYSLVCLIWPRLPALSADPAPAPAPSAGPWRARLIALGSLTAVAVLSVLLSAIQILPTIEWIPQLKREVFTASEPMPGFYILNFVVRHMAASPLNVVGAYIPNGAMYAGLVTLVVAPAALAHPRQREVWLFLLVLATSLQFTFGWGPLYWLHQLSPFRIDFPKTRIIVLADFSLAMLAGFGVAALTSPTCRFRRWLAGVIALAAVGLVWLLTWLPDAGRLIDSSLDPFSWPRAIFQGTAFSLAIVLACILALAVLSLRSRAFPSGSLLCSLIAVDILTFAYGHVPFSRTDLLLATPPAIQFLQERMDDSMRVISTRNVMQYNWEAQFRLATPSGYLYLTRIATDVMAPITIGPDPGVIELRLDRLLETRSPLLDFLGVRYLVASNGDGSAEQLAKHPDRFSPVFDDGFVRIFENPRALPRANLVPCDGIQVLEFTRRRISRVNSPAFDPRTMVVLEDSLRCPKVDLPGNDLAGLSQPVEVVEAGFNTYAVRATAAVPSLLVFADTYYVGWRAYVDGAEVPIVTANHAFKAVRVDPGEHQVRFVFDPWSFKLGAALSAAGLATVAALLTWSALGGWRVRRSIQRERTAAERARPVGSSVVARDLS